MGAEEEIHQDKGKPKANTTCRMRVPPKTLHTKPVPVATTQGQGDCKNVLFKKVKISHVPDQINSAGIGHVSKRCTDLTAFVQLANELAAFFNFNFRVFQLARDLASLANHQGLLTVDGLTQLAQNIHPSCFEFAIEFASRAHQDLISGQLAFDGAINSGFSRNVQYAFGCDARTNGQTR